VNLSDWFGLGGHCRYPSKSEDYYSVRVGCKHPKKMLVHQTILKKNTEEDKPSWINDVPPFSSVQYIKYLILVVMIKWPECTRTREGAFHLHLLLLVFGVRKLKKPFVVHVYQLASLWFSWRISQLFLLPSFSNLHFWLLHFDSRKLSHKAVVLFSW